MSTQTPHEHVPPPQTPAQNGHDQDPQNIAAALADISERATLLVHEEIELAKAEVTEKATRLARGSAVGAIAGVFLFFALVFVLNGCAWLLYYYLPIGNAFTYFWGFFAMAVILVVLGTIAGLIAWRVIRRGAPPTPDMAIDEARKIKDTVTAPPGPAPVPTPGAPAATPATAAAPSPAQPPPAAAGGPAATVPPSGGES